MKHRGLYVTLEGIDGSGKSTLAKNLENVLKKQGHTVVLTKEPGGTSIGRLIRSHLEAGSLDPKAEFLLFAADRTQHFTELVIPGLGASKIVLSDRGADSSLAYQGYGRGLDISMIRQVNAWAMQQHVPDCILYVRIAPDIARERIAKSRNETTSFEQEQHAFWERVVNGYEEIFADNPAVTFLDGTQSPEQLINAACAAIQRHLRL